MAYRIQQGQVENLESDLSSLSSRIVLTGSDLTTYVNDEIDALSLLLAETGSLLEQSIQDLEDYATVESSGFGGQLQGATDSNLQAIFEFIDNLTFQATSGDSLGDHRATGIININQYDITGFNTGNWTGNLLGAPNSLTGVFKVLDLLETSAGAGDNLGNHTATQTLNLNNNNITGVNNLGSLSDPTKTGHFTQLNASNLDVAGSIACGDISGSIVDTEELFFVTASGQTLVLNTITADSGNFDFIYSANSINSQTGYVFHLHAHNVEVSGDLDVTDGHIIGPIGRVTHLRTGLFSTLSGEYIYGSGGAIRLDTGNWTGNLLGVDGSITGLAKAVDILVAAGGDNLGNHTATQNLNMATNSITGVVSISGDNAGFDTLNASTVFADEVYGGIIHASQSLSGSGIFGSGDSITVNTGSFAGNLAGAQGNIGALFEKVDSLTLGGGSSELKLCVPFNYMNLSKCFTTGAIGWVTEEEDVSYCYSAGGYESALNTMQSGTVWLDLPIPYGATGFSTTDCLEMTLVGDTGSSAHNKLDISFLTSSGNMTNNSTRYYTTGWVPTTSGVPEVFSLDKTDLFDSTLSGHSKAKLKIEWYSFTGHSIKLINGSLNFVG